VGVINKMNLQSFNHSPSPSSPPAKGGEIEFSEGHYITKNYFRDALCFMNWRLETVKLGTRLRD
jgi:hypothetical protein